MWVVDIYGKGLDLSTGRGLTFVLKEPGSHVFGVVLYGGDLHQAILKSDHSSPIFAGTEAECRAYIVDLVGKLNGSDRTLAYPAELELSNQRSRIVNLEQRLSRLEPKP